MGRVVTLASPLKELRLVTVGTIREPLKSYMQANDEHRLEFREIN